MSTSHLAFVATPAIVGRKAAFGLCRLDWGNQYDCKKHISIQDGELSFGFEKKDEKGTARSDLVERTSHASVPSRWPGANRQLSSGVAGGPAVANGWVGPRRDKS